MIKTILVDDEQRGLSSLRRLIELHCPQLEIIDECRDAVTALASIQSLRPQLLFLDIAMPGKNGFDLLKHLPALSFEVIFVTAFNQYAIQAFQYSAVDYLLKPVKEESLIQAVERAADRISRQQATENLQVLQHNLQKAHKPVEMKLCIPGIKGFQFIQLSDIIYCEARNTYTIFHLAGRQDIVSSKPIIEYEQLLGDSLFCRVHKSYLINLSHVKEYIRGEGGTVILSNDKEVEVSRRKKEIFIGLIREYFKM
jgi:two-component system LytT family response regulator